MDEDVVTGSGRVLKRNEVSTFTMWFRSEVGSNADGVRSSVETYASNDLIDIPESVCPLFSLGSPLLGH